MINAVALVVGIALEIFNLIDRRNFLMTEDILQSFFTPTLTPLKFSLF